MNPAPPKRPAVFIECTNTYHSAVQTGIQRVVRNILREAAVVADARGYDLLPIVCHAGQFRVADIAPVLRDKLRPAEVHVPPSPPPSWRVRLRRLRARRLRDILLPILLPFYRAFRRALAILLPFPAAQRFIYAHPVDFGLGWCLMLPWRHLRTVYRRFRPAPLVEAPADPDLLGDGFGISLDAYPSHAGNFIVLLDGSWSIPIWPAVERFQAAGGVAVATVHDLVPVINAETAQKSLRTEFTLWIAEHLRISGRFVTVSQTVAGQLRPFLERLVAEGAPAQPRHVAHFYLGSELDFVDTDAAPRPEVARVFEGPEHVFIFVGSIEPRKNHRYALDAFDLLWARGSTVRLVLIGRFGWKNEDILARIAAHKLLGQKLFLMRDMDDSELDYAYRQASALVIPSEAEGFGLPVVEAFQRGLPVLCSDIPVFREIAGGRATFFDLAAPQHLAEVVTRFAETHDPRKRTERNPLPWLTWRESAAMLLDRVLGPEPAADVQSAAASVKA